MFELHPQLTQDTFFLVDWTLSRVVLMNNKCFPWVILVPRRLDLREIYQLETSERTLLIEEIAKTSQCLERAFGADKINVAALGNQVPQLHVHVVVRKCNDLAWPLPVWGSGHHQSYAENNRDKVIESFKDLLK